MGPEQRRARAGVLLLLVLAGCRHHPISKHRTPALPPTAASARASGDVVLARFDQRALTLRELEDHLSRQPEAVRTEYATAGARQRLLENLVRLELLANEARRRGVDRLPAVKLRISEILVEEMTNQLFGQKAAPDEPISDDDVARYYAAHAAEFHTPEERRASDIVLPDATSAETILKKAQASPMDEGRFRQLARDAKEPESRASAGDLGFFSRTSRNRPPEPIVDAVFALSRPGDVHPTVIATGSAFHVVMLTGIRPPLDRTLAEADPLIRSRLMQDRRAQALEAFVDALRKKAGARLYPERLGGIDAPR